MINKKSTTLFIVDSIGEHRGLHYHNFPLASELCSFGLRVILLSTPETCIHELIPDNIESIGIFKGIYGKRSKFIRGINYLFSLIRLIYWCIKEKPHLIHFHFFQIPLLDLMTILFLRALDFSIVSSIHDILPLHVKYDSYRFSSSIYKLIYQYSTALNVHSNYVYSIITKSYPILKSKIFITRLGNYLFFKSSMNNKWQLNKDQAKISIGLTDNEALILIFGTIKPNKRLDWVINSFKLVVEKYQHTKLVIVGSLQDRNIERELHITSKLGLKNNIIFRLEKVSDRELFTYLTAADIVIFPYEYIYQSAGIIMAMSFGKTILATDVGSNSEMIQSGRTGFFVDMSKPEELADAIIYLLTNQSESQKMGIAALEYIRENHSWRKIAQETFENYKRFLPKS